MRSVYGFIEKLFTLREKSEPIHNKKSRRAEELITPREKSEPVHNKKSRRAEELMPWMEKSEPNHTHNWVVVMHNRYMSSMTE